MRNILGLKFKSSSLALKLICENLCELHFPSPFFFNEHCRSQRSNKSTHSNRSDVMRSWRCRPKAGPLMPVMGSHEQPGSVTDCHVLTAGSWARAEEQLDSCHIYFGEQKPSWLLLSLPHRLLFFSLMIWTSYSRCFHIYILQFFATDVTRRRNNITNGVIITHDPFTWQQHWHSNYWKPEVTGDCWPVTNCISFLKHSIVPEK